MNRVCEKCGVTMFFDKDGCECTSKQLSEIRTLARYGSKPHLLLKRIIELAKVKGEK